MEIFRNYISRNDKKLTMDDSWSKVCCRWANSLDLADVKDLMSLVDDLLSPVSLNRRGIFEVDFVREMIENDRNGKEDNAYQIYQLLTIELWFREFVDK